MAYHALYQKAKYYDIIFDRDVSHEVHFLQQVFEENTGRPMQSVIEIASGPGYHALAFAERGLLAWALDLQGEMLDIGKEKAAARGLVLNWMEANMCDFDLPEIVDAAVGMFDSLTVLPTNELIIQHFQAVARNLRPDGLYILDFGHPRVNPSEVYGTFYWHGERDGVKVELIWPTNRPEIDLVSSTVHVEVELRVDDHGEKKVYRDTALERIFTWPQEITMLAQLSGVFKDIAWFGNFMLDQPLDHSPRSQRMIGVFQKIG